MCFENTPNPESIQSMLQNNATHLAGGDMAMAKTRRLPKSNACFLGLCELRGAYVASSNLGSQSMSETIDKGNYQKKAKACECTPPTNPKTGTTLNDTIPTHTHTLYGEVDK